MSVACLPRHPAVAYLLLVKRMRIAFMAVLTVLFGTAFLVHAQSLQSTPSAAQLRDWASPDCINAGKYVGIDYMQALNRAIAKDRAGLATLLRFTNTSAYDGGAGEGHLAILIALLQRWGDRPFAQVLRSQKPPVRKAVIDDLDLLIRGYGEKPSRLFPRTFASAPPPDA